MPWYISVAVRGNIGIAAICLKLFTNRLAGLLQTGTKWGIYFSCTELILFGWSHDLRFFNWLRVLFVKVCTCPKFTLGRRAGWCLVNDSAIWLSILRAPKWWDCFLRKPIHIIYRRLNWSSLRLFGDRWLGFFRLGKVTPWCFLTFRLNFLPLHPVCVDRALWLLLAFR